MNKLIFCLLITVSIFVSLGMSSKTIEKNQSAFFNPMPTPKIRAEIETIELDKNEAVYACPYFPSPYGCGKDEKGEIKKDNLLVTVQTVVRNPKNASLIYEYAVSGGKIDGQGDKVVWNLENVRPGTYTITVSIKGKRGVSSETKTETVRVIECECHFPCICPTIFVVTGGGVVKPGETISFEAEVRGGTAIDISYTWTVSQGEIIEGQGTPKIKVKTTSGMSGKVVATVELSDNLCVMCLRTASETALIEN